MNSHSKSNAKLNALLYSLYAKDSRKDQIHTESKPPLSFKVEILAGITTFLSAMYIIIVNPSILQLSGMPFQGVLTATILTSAFGCLLMGILGKNPILVAPGMGLNAFFTYTLVLHHKLPWQEALGVVFWSGAIFLLLSLLKFREKVARAIPPSLRYGVAAGIGLFIALIGLINAGFITSNPATVLGRGPLNAMTWTFLTGLGMTALLVMKGVRGALMISIFFTTLVSVPIGRWWGDASAVNHGLATLVTWKGLLAWPDFSVFFQADLLGALKWVHWPFIFSFLFTDLFDTLSTFIAVAHSSGLKDEEGRPLHFRQALLADAITTMFSGLFGTSSGTSYIESITGIQEGGRTGWVAVVAGLLFLPFLFLSPLVSLVPSLATAPVLVIVGVFMMGHLHQIEWSKWEESIPAFLAFIFIPFTFSITQGILWGFLSYTLLKIGNGKAGEITPTLMVINLFCILFLFI